MYYRIKRQGFTLIELLVVIAIIALLAAILFPVFGRARENARRSSCQSNLKQIGIGIMQYVQDYDETMPFNSNGGNGTQPDVWLHSMQPYIKSYQVLRCPSDSLIAGDPASGSANTSYGLNVIGHDSLAAGDTSPYFPPVSRLLAKTVKLAQIEAPSTTVQMLETAKKSGATNFSNFQLYTARSIGSTSGDGLRAPSSSEPRTLDAYYGGSFAGQIVERHLGTTNVLWCDGHVKAMNLDSLYRIVPNTLNEKILTYFTCKADPD